MIAALTTVFTAALARVGVDAATMYARCSKAMSALVNQAMEQRDDLPELLGPNDAEAMRSSYTGHARLMSVVFAARSTGLLLDTLTWVYRSYVSRGFSPDYFPAELLAWKNAIQECVSSSEARELARFYDALILHHQDFLSLSRQPKPEVQVSPDARPHFERYLEALLKPSADEAVELTRSHVSTAKELRFWWLEVIKPAMYYIGSRWEEGSLTASQEHAATSITQRVMAILYPMVMAVPHDKGAVVFAVSPGELHEIGARMASDLLELGGWNVTYAGAETPVKGIVDSVRRQDARALCISTTMPTNLGYTRALIQSVHPELTSHTMVIVGGQAYSSDDSLWKFTGADVASCNDEEVLTYLAGG